MQHLKDKLYDHTLRHKKSKIAVQPEANEHTKENVSDNSVDAKDEHTDTLTSTHPVAVHEARMRLVAASKPSQQPSANTSAPHNQAGDDDTPSAVLKANRHMQIFASRSAPPVDVTGSHAVAYAQRNRMLMTASPGDLRIATGGIKALDIPAELLRSQRHTAIIASRHAASPADAKIVTTNAPSQLPMPVQRAKVRVASNTSSVAPSTPVEASSLPPELAESQRHMAIMAARHAAPPVDANAGAAGQQQPPPPVPVPVAQKAKIRVANQNMATPSIPTARDIIQYRYHHGANLGSVYVVERWLTPSAFPGDAPNNQTSELSCVSLWVKQIGIESTRLKFEERWSRAMCEDDWKWLVNVAHCKDIPNVYPWLGSICKVLQLLMVLGTSIRLPIGYFTLGPDFCAGTPFEAYGAVYQNAWKSVRQLIERARTFGIGVLIDLHALPGGANSGEHSGTNLKTVDLWNNTRNLDLATSCVEHITRDVGSVDGVIGLQLCNEAVTDAEGMYDWWYVQCSNIGL